MSSEKSDTPSSCCGGRSCSPKQVPRRDFLRLAALLPVGAAALRRSAFAEPMAGPFVREDFLRLIPQDKKLDPAWLASLTRRGEPETFRGEALQRIGMPVGGLFCGTLYLGGDGRLWLWDLFNGRHLGIEPKEVPFRGANLNALSGSSFVRPLLASDYRRVGQGFRLHIKSDTGTITKTLDAEPGTGFKDVAFTGQYPIGRVEYQDPALPLEIRLEAFSPFVPLDLAASTLPATVFSFQITNRGAQPVEAFLEGHLENAVFHLHRSLRGERHRQTIDIAGTTIASLTATLRESDTPALPDEVFEDWKQHTFAAAGWTVEGSAFGEGPVDRGAMPAYIGDIGGKGERFAHSHVGNSAAAISDKDNLTGRLLSRPFEIRHRFIRVWIGGGADLERLGLRVLVDDKAVRSLAGKNANAISHEWIDVSEFVGRQARIVIEDNASGTWAHTGVGQILFTDRSPVDAQSLKRLRDDGSMALSLVGDPADLRDPDASAPLANKLEARLGRRLVLAPGAGATVEFVLAWHFKNAPADILGGRDRIYAARFPDAATVAAHVARNLPVLTAKTRAWRDTWYDSSLPHWFLNRTFANTSILATDTCYYFADRRFYADEGVGCCPGTCTHVWQYAQAMGRLFPEIERDHREKVDFGLALKPDGTIAFRGEFGDTYAIDGQAGRILGVLREHQMSSDPAFLRRLWPSVKRAIEKMINTDQDNDGIVVGPLHNTLDADWLGLVPWLCGMYHAGLAAGEAMALELGEPETARRYREIREAGQRKLEKCWREDYGYYVQLGDPQRKTEVGPYEGCHIDQVFGQSWAWQVGLGPVFPSERARRVLGSLWRFNFTPDVGPFRDAKLMGRWYALPGDGGMIMVSNPFAPDIEFTGPSAPTAQYFNECMSGFEHQVASHMLWENMIVEGLAVTRAIHDRYHPSLRNPYNEIECSDHYARAMASYGTYLAACGYEYHGPQQRIGFDPRLGADDFRAAFTASEAWGSFAQRKNVSGVEASLQIRHGSLPLRTLSLRAPRAALGRIRAAVDNTPAPASLRHENGRAIVEFSPPLVLPEGATLRVALS